MSEGNEQKKSEPDWAEFLNHSRSLFIYHAGQRLNSTRYFFAIYGVVFAGYLSVLRESDIDEIQPYALSAIACFGLIVAVVYWVLDRRNAELVHVDENAMYFAEQRMLEKIETTYTQSGFPNQELVRSYARDHKYALNIASAMDAAPKAQGGFSYGNAMSITFLLAIAAPFCAIAFHVVVEILPRFQTSP